MYEKYLNQNLLVISFFEPQKEQEEEEGVGTVGGRKRVGKLNNLIINLIDITNGNQLKSFSIPNVKKTKINLHINENLILCQFENEKLKRSELFVFELFKDSNKKLLIKNRGFILPKNIKTISSTKTLKGITAKMFLFGYLDDRVYGFHKYMIDPMRPDGIPTPAESEDFLTTYDPKLISFDNQFITLNRTIFGLESIETFTANLESTSHVFIFGLDIFYTRIFPALEFDFLNDNFSFNLLLTTTFGLILLTIFSYCYSKSVKSNLYWQ